MTRTILAIGAFLLAASMLFGSAAEACISCEYKPEVLNARPAAKTYESKGSYGAYDRIQVYKKRAADSARRSKKVAPARVESARAAPTKKQPEADLKSTEPETATKAGPAPSDSAASDASKEAPKVAEKAGCRKFFPNVGVTVAVPCE